jgi:hypothetical protein
MPKFPQTDSELRALAQKVIAGLKENQFFPSPPVSSSDLQNRLDEFDSLSDTQVANYAIAEQSTDSKAVGRDSLAAELKANLRYAEYAAAGDDAKLSMLGWGTRPPQTPITVPGQPLKLQIVRSGPGEAKATWGRPIEGGPAACYIIKMRVSGGEGGSWISVGTFFGVKATLINLERGKELEFCGVALNKAGESLPSNSVTVVL